VAILGCLGLLLARVGWLQIVSPDNLVKQEDNSSPRQPSMATQSNPKRIGVKLAADFIFLFSTIAWLQIVSPDNLVKQEDMRSLREEPVAVERGMITDRPRG
jgi:cell division protein FtsI/penicillin-binding protein 2